MNNIFQKTQHLIVINSPSLKETFSLEKNLYALGRHSSNDIIIPSNLISRHHATLLKIQYQDSRDDVFWIIDGDLKGNKSTNGIMVNGKRCLSHELKNGDQIFLASNIEIKYYQTKQDEVIELKKPENTNNSAIVLEDFKTTLIPENFIDNNSQEFFKRLTSYPKFFPHPIIEINYQGEITYLNSIAQSKFPNISDFKNRNHPIIEGLISQLEERKNKFLIREIQINETIFEQYAHYLSPENLIRSYLFDITKQKQVELALQESEEKYKAVVRQISEGIFLVDLEDRKIIDCNQAYCRLSGYELSEITNLTLYDLMPIDDDVIDSYLEIISNQNQDLILESCHCSKDGALIDVEVGISLISYAETQVLCFVVRDIRQRKATENFLKKKAYFDDLTGLANRVLFNERLSKAIEQAVQNQQQLALLFIDLDHFKKINDSLGHTVGDKLLKNFAKRALACLNPHQIIARWGGDEFVILMPNIQSTQEVTELSEQLIASLQQPFMIEGHQLHIRMSIGIAIYPQDGQDQETLLKNADAVLYRIKEQGRNFYQFYNPTVNLGVSEQLNLENLLHQALEKEEFFLLYQPQINVKNLQITGMETLLRWHCAEKGCLIAPSDFIPLAEDTGLIIPIGEWILKNACRQNQIWQEAGLPKFRISVNLSPRQLYQSNLVDTIKSILTETGLEPQYLELEITESTLIQNREIVLETILALTKIGVQFALDDFGTGYASLGYLKKFPFHTLKIDRGFIHDLTESEQNKALIAAILTLGKGFNLKVVAEGVETVEQLELLTQLECQEMQGYLLSRPLLSTETKEFLVGYRDYLKKISSASKIIKV